MKLSLDKTLSLVAIGVLGTLGTLPAQAEELKDQAYEIVNIEDFDLKGTLPGTQRGYGMGVNSEGKIVGVSRGRKQLRDEDVDDDLIDIEDGIAPEEQIVFSVNEPIVANNFTFISSQNEPEGAWTPVFDSLGGSKAPIVDPNADPATVNSVDAIYYAIGNSGTKVGSVSGPEKTIKYTGETEGQEFWYYRDFELRGIAKTGAGDEIELVPSYTTYTYKPENGDSQDVNLGGLSVAADIEESADGTSLITGYGSTGIAEGSKDRIDACFAEGATLPVDICVQANQFPSSVSGSAIQYQMRGFVWQLDNAGGVTATELPLGLTPAEDSTSTFSAQGLGINANGVVAGRADTFRDGDTDDRRLDAGYWLKEKNAEGVEQYVFKPVRFPDREYYNTIAYDINDQGLLIGAYQRYLEGYLRTKFFTLDTTTDGAAIETPKDFYSTISDLSSVPKDINNNGMVVGSIETTHDKEVPRPKSGFLYSSTDGQFVDLNKVLTCESRGLEADGDSWKRHEVTVTDGSGKELSYKAEIRVVEADTINDDGMIVGTAFVRKPMYQVDDEGKLVLVNNQPVFELNANGQPLTSFLPRAVVLKPAASSVLPCDYVDEEDDDAPYERKGAAGFGWLMLLPLLWLRRKLK